MLYGAKNGIQNGYGENYYGAFVILQKKRYYTCDQKDNYKEILELTCKNPEKSRFLFGLQFVKSIPGSEIFGAAFGDTAFACIQSFQNIIRRKVVITFSY